MTYKFPYRILVAVPVAHVAAARAALAAQSGTPEDATATWRDAVEVSALDDTPTHEWADMLARPEDVAALPALAAMIPGATYRLLESERGGVGEVQLESANEALTALGLIRLVYLEDGTVRRGL